MGWLLLARRRRRAVRRIGLELFDRGVGQEHCAFLPIGGMSYGPLRLARCDAERTSVGIVPEAGDEWRLHQSCGAVAQWDVG
jgi:hypothetical protein